MNSREPHDPCAALTNFCETLNFARLPQSAVTALKAMITDALACAMAGSAAPLNAEIVARHVRWGGSPEATVLGFEQRLPMPTAAFLNALLIHSHDYDDAHLDANQHVLVTVLPAALAAAECRETPIGGRDLLAAVAGAAELQLRLGIALLPSMPVAWLPTSVFGAIGAAAAAARMLGLTGERFADAVGLGYAQAQGNRQGLIEGKHAKRLIPAFAARAGVHGAVLAQLGVTGPREIVSGTFGLRALFGDTRAAVEPAVDAGLGTRYELERTALKPYPCCRAAHRSIDMAAELAADHGPLAAPDIEAIDLWLYPRGHTLVGRPFQLRGNPQIDAQFSAQWVVAHTLMHGPPGLRHFEPEAVAASTDTAALAAAITVHQLADPNPATAIERLRVRLRDGRELATEHRHVSGDVELPLSRSQRMEKFTDCAAHAYSPLDRSLAIDVFEHLEDLESICDLRPLLDQLRQPHGRLANERSPPAVNTPH